MVPPCIISGKTLRRRRHLVRPSRQAPVELSTVTPEAERKRVLPEIIQGGTMPVAFPRPSPNYSILIVPTDSYTPSDFHPQPVLPRDLP